MNKIFFRSFLIIFFCFFLIFSCDKKTQVENRVTDARTKKYRSVTEINNLPEKLVTEYALETVGGVYVKHTNQETIENIVFKDLDKAYEDDTQFKITLIDRYGLKYEKVFEASKKGNTDVVIEESDYVKQSGDWKRQIERKLN